MIPPASSSVIPNNLAAVKMYMSSLGGEWPVLFWFCLVFAFLICELGNIIQTWYVKRVVSIIDPKFLAGGLGIGLLHTKSTQGAKLT